MVSFVAHFGPVSVNFDRSLAYSLPLSQSKSSQSAVSKKACQRAGLICRTNENLSSNLKVLIGLFFKPGFRIFKPRF